MNSKTVDDNPESGPTTLASESAGNPQPAPDNKVSGTLDALAGVIPAAIIGMYTTAVLVLRGVALTAGKDERAELQAGWVAEGRTAAQIEQALKRLPEESKELIELRWLLILGAVTALVLVTIRAARAAADPPRKPSRFPLAELVTGTVALIAWALAAPGTPLAAYQSADRLLAYTATIAGIAGLILWALGSIRLTKPQS